MNLTPFFLNISRVALIRMTHVLVTVCMLAVSYGCTGQEKPAPKPTINPSAHVTQTIRVTVSDPHVYDVTVGSNWQLGNFGCAPIIYPEGYLNDPSVGVNEKITKIGNVYVAKILIDRFQNDKCKWFISAVVVNLMRDNRRYAAFFKPDEVPLRYFVCLPSPIGLGVCVLKHQLNSKEKQIKRPFKLTVELLP